MEELKQLVIVTWLAVAGAWVLRYVLVARRQGQLVGNKNSPLPLAIPHSTGIAFAGTALLFLLLKQTLFFLLYFIGALYLGILLQPMVVAEQVGWKKITFRGWLGGSLMVASTALLVDYPVKFLVDEISQGLTHSPVQDQDVVKTFRWAVQHHQVTGLFIQAVLIAPLLEELFFRGFLYTLLKKYLPIWGALVVSSFFFSLAHEDLGAFLPLWLFGLILGLAYEHTGALMLSIGVHSVFNLTTALYLLWEGNGGT